MFHSKESSIQNTRNSVFGGSDSELRVLHPSVLNDSRSVTRFPEIDTRILTNVRSENRIDQVIENTQSETNVDLNKLTSGQAGTGTSLFLSPRAMVETMIKQESKSKLSVVTQPIQELRY